MNMYNLSQFKLFWDPALDTKALLAWNQDTAVLAFRGTASLTNAWSDLQVLRLVCIMSNGACSDPRGALETGRSNSQRARATLSKSESAQCLQF